MPNQNKKYKIALIGDCLALGGAEKVMALLSIYFEKQKIEVHNCIFIDSISYEYSGTLFNLGEISPNSNSITRKLNRFMAFKKFINSNNFDFIIDFRVRPSFLLEFLLSKFIYPKSIIYTIHSGFLNFYFPNSKWVSRLIYKNQRFIAVCEAIKIKTQVEKDLSNVKTIYNPIDFNSISILENKFNVNEKYILAIGRMNDDIKQIDHLILAYSKSDIPKQNIKLFILGDGKNRIVYQKLVDRLNLSDLVVFKGIVKNPFPFYKNALFVVLSSKNEGFPNVIIESLACKTPVISFDCFSGPNEIITNEINGLLVEDQNFEKITKAMNQFIHNTILYQKCKKNTLDSVQKFSLDNIGQQWLNLMKI